MRIAAARDMHQIAGRSGQEQTLCVLDAGQHRLRHGVVQHRHDGVVIRRFGRRQARYLPGQPAFDPTYIVAGPIEAGAMQDIGGLARPWRDRAEARHNP
jgi:hypothetical protein